MFGKKNNQQFDPSSGKRIVSDILKTGPGTGSGVEIKKRTGPAGSLRAAGPSIPRSKSFDIAKKSNRKMSILLLIGLILVPSLFLGFILMRLFSSVSINITPRQEFRAINLAFKASVKDGTGMVPFEIMHFEETVQKSGKATGVKNISQKAGGTIAIFNSFSSKPQVLLRNTRFETPAGKIYRIDKSITVPGAKILNGKVEPSSIEAVVYAGEAGEAYNGPPTDFKIPGFRGTPKYEKIFARSKTPLSGGFAGKATIVVENDVSPMRIAIQNELRARLLARSDREKPEGFLMLGDSPEIKFLNESIRPAIGERADEFNISMEGNFSGALVRPGDVALAVIGKSFPDENPASIKITNFDSLSLKRDAVDFQKGEAAFNVSGNARFAWRFDENKLIEGLLVAPSGDREKVFSSQPSIQKAEIVFKPSWWRLFPSNSSKIKVIEILNNH